MSAGGLQLPGARLAARVGHQPGVVRGVHLLSAEAAVLGQPLSAAVLLAALGAMPARVRLVQLVRLLLILLLVHTVLGPFLDACQVQDAVAAVARPHLLGPPDRLDANEADGGSGHKVVCEELNGPLQVACPLIGIGIGPYDPGQYALRFEFVLRRRALFAFLRLRQKLLQVLLDLGAGLLKLPVPRSGLLGGWPLGGTILRGVLPWHHDGRRRCGLRSTWRSTPRVSDTLRIRLSLMAAATSATTHGPRLLHPIT